LDQQIANNFSPSLKSFGINPDQVIFVNLKSEKNIFWCVEEALKCERVTAVVGELSELGFTESRRLQLAVEQSGVTGFILRVRPHNVSITACVTRWKITSLPSELPDGVPGVGFPRWNVELLKVRNGKPGSWWMEWVGQLRDISQVGLKVQEQRMKVG
jgi:protein ImuA